MVNNKTGIDILNTLIDDYGYSKTILAMLAGIGIAELRKVSNGVAELESYALEQLSSLLTWSETVKDKLPVDAAAWFEHHLIFLGEGNHQKVLNCYQIPLMTLLPWSAFTDYTIANAETFYSLDDLTRDYPMEFTVKKVGDSMAIIGHYGVEFLPRHQFARGWACRQLRNLTNQ